MSGLYQFVCGCELQLKQPTDLMTPARPGTQSPEQADSVDSDANRLDLAEAVRAANGSAGLLRQGATPPGVGSELDVTV